MNLFSNQHFLSLSFEIFMFFDHELKIDSVFSKLLKISLLMTLIPPTYISWNCDGLQCIHVALQFKKLSKSSNLNREKEQFFILTQIYYLLKIWNNLFNFETEHFTIFFGLSFIQFTLISFVYFSNLKNGVYSKFPLTRHNNASYFHRWQEN